jgi:hypothetical protein
MYQDDTEEYILVGHIPFWWPLHEIITALREAGIKYAIRFNSSGAPFSLSRLIYVESSKLEEAKIIFKRIELQEAMKRA